jgi:hypothetical protein
MIHLFRFLTTLLLPRPTHTPIIPTQTSSAIARTEICRTISNDEFDISRDVFDRFDSCNANISSASHVKRARSATRVIHETRPRTHAASVNYDRLSRVGVVRGVDVKFAVITLNITNFPLKSVARVFGGRTRQDLTSIPPQYVSFLEGFLGVYAYAALLCHAQLEVLIPPCCCFFPLSECVCAGHVLAHSASIASVANTSRTD